MLTTVRFLEAMGSMPLSGADYSAAVAMLEIDAPQRQALMDRDKTALCSLLAARDTMCCLIVAAEDDSDF